MKDIYRGLRLVRELASPSAIERYFKRVVAVTLKGFACADCGSQPTWQDVRMYEFDHDVPVNDGSAMDKRWTVMRHRPMKEIIAWLPTVTLRCLDCHIKKTGGIAQLEIDWSAQGRLDEQIPW